MLFAMALEMTRNGLPPKRTIISKSVNVTFKLQDDDPSHFQEDTKMQPKTCCQY